LIASSNFSHSKYLYYSLLLVWLIVNLIQAGFTELWHDEAYYYFYSSNLALGYYDHPPVIALMIKLGTMLLKNELGVRLVSCLLSVLTIIILVKITEVRNYLLFFAILFSVFSIHVGGFLAVPDIPLIFFTALFFFFYRRYLWHNRWIDVILLAISIAALMYSKYLGVFVIFFTFISNIRLIRRSSFWVLVVIVILLMIPHLFWQYKNDFVTFYFHMVERSHDKSFEFKYILDYIINQLVIMNPFIAVIIFIYAIKYKALDYFDKALKFNAFGVLLLGFLFTIKSRVEPNWTVTAFLPLIILAYKGVEQRIKVHRVIYIFSLISLLLIFILRIFMVYNFLPDRKKMEWRIDFHEWDTWAEQINEVAGERPVVFFNSYQQPSKYMFYTGNPSFTFNYLGYKNNQYDLTDIERDLFHQEVCLISGSSNFTLYDTIPDPNRLETVVGTMYYKIIPDWRSYNFFRIKILLDDNVVSPNSDLDIPIEIINPLDSALIISDKVTTYLTATFFQHGLIKSYDLVEDITALKIDKFHKTTLQVKTPASSGTYYLSVGIKTGWLPAGLNSRFYKIIVR